MADGLNEERLDFDKQIENLGYIKLSDQTWYEHCKNNKSLQLEKVGNLMPNCTEFFDQIVFQKKYNLRNITNIIIEIARPKKANKAKPFNFISEYRVGFVFVNPNNPIIVRRVFWELMSKKNLVPFIKQCEKEVNYIVELLEIDK